MPDFSFLTICFPAFSRDITEVISCGFVIIFQNVSAAPVADIAAARSTKTTAKTSAAAVVASDPQMAISYRETLTGAKGA